MPNWLTAEDQQWLQHKVDTEWAFPPNQSNRTRLGQTFKSTQELRWVTLGHQYDWTTRSYDSYVPFPKELAELAQKAVAQVISSVPLEDQGLCKEIVKGWGALPYRPNCAIINFYRGSDRLRGHTDEVECNDGQGIPLVSLSLGNASALFLLESSSQDDTPITFILRPGDVLILGGESRCRMHSVPRLLEKGTTQTRINISVRQKT